MNWALIDTNNIVQNIIMYDGISLYIPAEGFTLHQVGNWICIGQAADTPQPTPIIAKGVSEGMAS